MEKANANSESTASVIRGSGHSEEAHAEGFYFVECFDKEGNLKWQDSIKNVVCTEGKNAALQAILKASAFTQVSIMGLIGNTTYSAPVAGNTAGAIATSGSANSWNEATSGVSSVRKDVTSSVGTPSAGSVSISAQSFSITGTDTINGCFVLIKSLAGVSPTTAVANTSGALWSAGAFSGGGRAVVNGDTLSVTYSTSL